MAKYLIFRTDRIGDFIFSRILTEAIKFKNHKNIIDFVCSKYNSEYIKNFKDINKIYILDKYNLSLLIKNILEINKEKYDFIIILDGKRRSIFFSLFLIGKKKFAIIKDFRPKIILKFFFNRFFVNSEVNSQFDNFSSIINYLDFKIPKKINYYAGYKLKRINPEYIKNRFTLLHLDEKWFEGYYYNDFKYMDLNEKNFDYLIQTIFKRFKKNILITSGRDEILPFKKIKTKYFYKYKKNIFRSKKYTDRVQLIEKTDFRELETIVSKSSEIICCEGAISHVSNAFNKLTFALVNFKIGNTGFFWTKHMNKIKIIYRNNLKSICKSILEN